MRLIDADALYTNYINALWYDNDDRELSIDYLLDAPTINAPERDTATWNQLAAEVLALQAELDGIKSNQLGCDYCNLGSDMSTAQNIDAWINGDVLIISDLNDAEHINIKYCPICGRKI